MTPLSSPFQSSSVTHYNRYSNLWRRVQGAIPREDPRILIVGCSTGEECFTALAYFPLALIVATEAAPIPLALARLLHHHPSITYLSHQDQLPSGSFDLICCNSVLCNHPSNYDKDYVASEGFIKFSAAIEDLSSHLKNGALLMLANAEFRLSDTPSAPSFTPITTPLLQHVAVFDSKGYRTNDRTPSIWRKTS